MKYIWKDMLTDIKLSKTQRSKIIQSGGFLGSLLSKITCTLMKVSVPIAKNILARLGLTAAASAIDVEGNSKENTWLWDNNFNNFKWRN